MDPADLQLLRELEKGIPLVPYPYAEIAVRLDLSEEEVLSRIASMKDTGIIRRMRARINQRSVGIVANALVAWTIPEEESDLAGSRFAQFSGVTHCYRRSPVKGRWEYSVYTVHHGWFRMQVEREIAMIAKETGYDKYLVMFSQEEYKRTPHTRVADLEKEL